MGGSGVATDDVVISLRQIEKDYRTLSPLHALFTPIIICTVRIHSYDFRSNQQGD